MGGYSSDTLVEDQDLTLAVLARGYKVIYVPKAIAYTEVPRSLRALYYQRFRWVYGTFQCAYKYRAHLLSDACWRLGFVALPYSVIFNVLMPVVAVVLYGAALVAAVTSLHHPSLLMLLVFALLDFAYGVFALRDDAIASRHELYHLVFQRFTYIVLYCVLVSFVALKVLDGSRTRWNKLARTGSAQAFYLDQGVVTPSSYLPTGALRTPEPLFVSFHHTPSV